MSTLKANKNDYKLFNSLDEMTNSATWRNVRSMNDIELTHDQLYDVMDYINNAISVEQAEQDNFLLYETIDTAIDQVVNQFN